MRFKALRGALSCAGYRIQDLIPVTGLGWTALSHRFTDKADFKISEMYAIMDFLSLPHSELAKYFPKNGKEV